MPEELDTDIVAEKIMDGEQEITGQFVRREKLVPKMMMIPLYRNGERIAENDLNALGLTVKRITRLEAETALYGGYYAMNPDLARRVRQYKGYLDQLGLAYSATSDDVAEAISISTALSDTEKLELGVKIKNCFSDIALNLEALQIESASFETWYSMPKLIRYLPPEEAEETPTENVTPEEPAPEEVPEVGEE